MDNIKVGYNNIDKAYQGNNQINKIGNTVLATDTSQLPYSQQYFTLVPKSGTTTFELIISNSLLEASTDGGENWDNIGGSYTITTDKKVLIRKWVERVIPTESSGIGRFTATNYFDVEGNIMSVFWSTGFENQTTLPYNYAFKTLFSGNTYLESAENLVLPATAMTEGCYMQMFNRCSNLSVAPKLPATVMANNCYRGMFALTNIRIVPALPATTLAESCYEYMFQMCNNIRKVENGHGSKYRLPATTLAPRCYANMFNGCTNSGFNAANIQLPATTLVSECYFQMFRGCSTMPVSPGLPATTLAYQCYRSMFADCSNLSHIRCNATNISAENCLYYWVGNVQTREGVFFKNANMNSFSRGQNGIPNNWVVRTWTNPDVL